MQALLRSDPTYRHVKDQGSTDHQDPTYRHVKDQGSTDHQDPTYRHVKDQGSTDHQDPSVQALLRADPTYRHVKDPTSSDQHLPYDNVCTKTAGGWEADAPQPTEGQPGIEEKGGQKAVVTTQTSGCGRVVGQQDRTAHTVTAEVSGSPTVTCCDTCTVTTAETTCVKCIEVKTVQPSANSPAPSSAQSPAGSATVNSLRATVNSLRATVNSVGATVNSVAAASSSKVTVSSKNTVGGEKSTKLSAPTIFTSHDKRGTEPQGKEGDQKVSDLTLEPSADIKVSDLTPDPSADIKVSDLTPDPSADIKVSDLTPDPSADIKVELSEVCNCEPGVNATLDEDEKHQSKDESRLIRCSVKEERSVKDEPLVKVVNYGSVERNGAHRPMGKSESEAGQVKTQVGLDAERLGLGQGVDTGLSADGPGVGDAETVEKMETGAAVMGRPGRKRRHNQTESPKAVSTTCQHRVEDGSTCQHKVKDIQRVLVWWSVSKG